MVMEGVKLLAEATDENRKLSAIPKRLFFFCQLKMPGLKLICVNLGRYLILPNYEFRYQK